MGENMLYIFGKEKSPPPPKGEGIRNVVGFPQSLPDATCGSSSDSRLAFTSYVYIGEVYSLNLQFLLLHGQFVNAFCAERLAGLLQRTIRTLGRCGGALDSAKVHQGLVELRWLIGREERLCQLREETFPLRGVDGSFASL